MQTSHATADFGRLSNLRRQEPDANLAVPVSAVMEADALSKTKKMCACVAEASTRQQNGWWANFRRRD